LPSTREGYLVKAQLSKAVDGAALAAARSFNSGNPGPSHPDLQGQLPGGIPRTATRPIRRRGQLYTPTVNAATGVNTVTVTATAVSPPRS